MAIANNMWYKICEPCAGRILGILGRVCHLKHSEKNTHRIRRVENANSRPFWRNKNVYICPAFRLKHIRFDWFDLLETIKFSHSLRIGAWVLSQDFISCDTCFSPLLTQNKFRFISILNESKVLFSIAASVLKLTLEITRALTPTIQLDNQIHISLHLTSSVNMYVSAI